MLDPNVHCISIDISMAVLKLTSVGTSTGMVIPKEMLADLKLEKGDRVFATKTPGGYLLTPYDPEVEQQIEAGREIMKEYRETFRALAK
jgi:putative addiction module antidote